MIVPIVSRTGESLQLCHAPRQWSCCKQQGDVQATLCSRICTHNMPCQQHGKSNQHKLKLAFLIKACTGTPLNSQCVLPARTGLDFSLHTHLKTGCLPQGSPLPSVAAHRQTRLLVAAMAYGWKSTRQGFTDVPLNLWQQGGEGPCSARGALRALAVTAHSVFFLHRSS